MKRTQRGVSLLPAIFLLVIVATLGAYAIRMGSSQRQSANLAMLSDRAVAAANAGLEWGASRALNNNICSLAPQTLNLAQGALNGFRVDVNCVAPITAHNEGAVAFRFVDITATARWGAYGSTDHVSRTVTKRFSNAP